MRLKIIFGILILIILGAAWISFVEPNMIKLEKFELKIKNLPAVFKGIKIVHLSDFHSKDFGKKERKTLEILNQLNPDFIFITGDIVDWKTRDFISCQDFWKELAINYEGKIFGVFGNHEHQNPKLKILKEILKESKIEILENESIILRRNEDFIYLIGVDDPHLGFDNIEKAMVGVEDERPKILLAHSPEIFRKVKDKNIDLVLTGHTHGSQINFPILDWLILPLKYDKQYKRGLFEENSTYLYVNRGIGTTFLPIRFNSFPEVTLITLTPQ